ncbi:MAG: FISUMP domain-containing protein [bacterium]
MNAIKYLHKKISSFNLLPKTLFYVIAGGTLSVLIGIGIVYALTSLTVTDSYNDSTKIASAVNVTVDTVNGQVFLSAASSWACGSPLLDTRDGKTYTTVLIGAQCWMGQNLNVGTRINGSVTQNTSTSTIQKYCYSDNEGSCTTYGGLYQWDQAMGGSVTEGAQGICPTGWHIPTHNEFTLLERTTCTSGSCATDFPYDSVTTGWRGTNEGTTLKNVVGLFRGLLAGDRETSGTFAYLGANGLFWESLQSGSSAWDRTLNSGYATVGRGTLSKSFGFSVRCLKN